MSKNEIYLCHFMCLESQLFSNLNVANACVYIIQSDFRNLAHTLQALSYVNDCLTAKRMVEIPVLGLSRTRVSVEKMFIDDKKRYLPTSESIQLFKTEGINFINKYHELSDAQIGVDGYNKRVLIHLLNSLSELSNELRDYSYV